MALLALLIWPQHVNRKQQGRKWIWRSNVIPPTENLYAALAHTVWEVHLQLVPVSLESADDAEKCLLGSKRRPEAGFPCLWQWCEQNEQCNRLHLPELLIAPLHRLTRYPLLLNNIWKRSTDETEKGFIQSLKEKVAKVKSQACNCILRLKVKHAINS